MTELLDGVEAPSDAELISRVRGGDVAAYGDLFARHVDAARRLGWQLVRGPDVDDLVSDAFAKTLAVLQNGGGPDVAFRAYLLTSLRRLHIDKLRAAKKVQPAEDMTVFDAGVPFRDSAVANFDNGAAAKAFSSLPERWQLVLWHLEVEGQKPADIAPLLGMSPNSVSALAYRAREGLRQAFLRMHLSDSPTERCRWVNEHLGAYVRKGLSKRDTTNVEEHLDGCRRCTAMYLELDEVNSNLAGIVAPLLLGAAAAGYVSSAGSAGATGVSAFFGRVRDAVSGNGTGAGAGAGGSAAGAGAGAVVTSGGLVTVGGLVAASVVAITAAAFVVGGSSDKEVVIEADQPVGIVQTPVPPAESESVESPADPEQDREDGVEALADDGVSAAGAHFQDEAPVETSGEQPLHQEADGTGVTPVGTADAPPAPSAGDPAPQPATRPGNSRGDTDTEPAPGDTDTEPAPGDTDTEPAPGDTDTDPATTPTPAEENDTPADHPGQHPPVQDPGTDQPSNDQPSNDQPGGDQPGSGPPPGDDGPPPDPGPPLAVTSTLNVSAGVVDDQVHFTLEADPRLPATVRVDLRSAPGGIVFANGGADCALDPHSPVTAYCDTTPTVLGAGMAGMRAVTSGGGAYSAALPLFISADQGDTVLSIAITASDDMVTAMPALSEPFMYFAPQEEAEAPGGSVPDGRDEEEQEVARLVITIHDPVRDDRGQPFWSVPVSISGLREGETPTYTLEIDDETPPRELTPCPDGVGVNSETDQALSCAQIQLPPGRDITTVVITVAVGDLSQLSMSFELDPSVTTPDVGEPERSAGTASGVRGG